MSFVYADMATILYRMIGVIELNECMSSQCCIDQSLRHLRSHFMKFSKFTGFQLTKDYPYVGVARPELPNWDNWQKKGEVRYTIPDFKRFKGEKNIRKAILKMIEDGNSYPCHGTLKADHIRDNPNKRHGDDLPGGLHAILIVGADMTSENSRDHVLHVKNSWGKEWRDSGFSEIPFSYLSCLVVPEFHRGTYASMRHYVDSLPIFKEDMNLTSTFDYQELMSSFNEITATILEQSQSSHISSSFPSKADVMSILAQRVMEDHVPKLLEKALMKPSLVNPSGALLLYLEMLVVGYRETTELAKVLRNVGCGDLNIEGLAESLFTDYKAEYIRYEKASLRQLYKDKMEQQLEQQLLSKSRLLITEEFVGWIEAASKRCVTLFFNEPDTCLANLITVYTCVIGQVTRQVLERAGDGLNEAAVTSASRRVASRRVAASSGSAGEAACSYRTFNVAMQHFESILAIVHNQFQNSILHAPLEAIMSNAKVDAYKHCVVIVMVEVMGLLSDLQKDTDYSPADNVSNDQPTDACIRVVTYLKGVLEAFPVKQLLLTELANHLYEGLSNHWKKYYSGLSASSRFKPDVIAYAYFLRHVKDSTVDEI